MSDTVAVVGGGITGLSAALTLSRALPPDVGVTVIEARDRLGGVIRTDHAGGALIEAGPDWFVTHRPEAVELCTDLGLEGDLVAPAVSGIQIWSRGQLRPLPDGFVRGIPSSARDILGCDHLSLAGRVRALADLGWPRRLANGDRSIGDFVRRRFGREVLERLVDPILAASRSGAADEMSLAAGAPEIDAAARSRRSVMRALSANREAGPAPGFLGIRGGMQRLIDALRKELRAAEVRTGTAVVGLAGGDTGYAVKVADGSRLTARGVVLAVPAYAAAALLTELDAEAARLLGGIEYAPAGVIGLVYPPGAVTVPAGPSGFLVPSSEKRVLAACAWFSSKWRHSTPPHGGTVVRCFVGGGGLELPDDDLAGAVQAELAAAAGIDADPGTVHIVRWDRALPVYAVGHLDRVAAVRRALRRHRRLAVAGAGYEGSGLPACIAAGREAALGIAATLNDTVRR
ncbi:MAG: protoporphyrinogen oxidase [Actinomycetota bacterium]